MNIQNIKMFLTKNKYILFIFALGLLMRLYNYKELFMYGHDQDLQGWFIRDILENHHLRLIGQETSTAGIFIGPIFYYLLIPFYLVFNMDPIGGLFMTVLLGIFTIWSFYFVLSRIFSKQTGLLAAFIYALSFYTVFNDKEVVPTMPVILWTVWYLWGLFLTHKGETLKGLMLLGLLTGLIWEMNMALIIVSPLILLSILLSAKKPNFRSVSSGLIIFLITSMPLLLFEFRHGFSQSKSFINSLLQNQHDVVSGFEKVKRVFYLLSKDFAAVVWGDYFDLKYEYIFWLFLVVFALLIFKNKIKKEIAVIFGIWILIYLTFFSLYSKIVSEYYLNGTIVVFIAVLALGLSNLLQKKKYRDFAKAFIILFSLVNIDRFISMPINKSGYVERNLILDEIKSDSVYHGYPCVSVSFITDLGYDRGYRYFMWLKDIKTKKISEKVPVYTIVFPLKDMYKTDKTFGALGLIDPDYGKYNVEKVRESCAGDDFNTHDPMIGFTN
jgi:hypothetical protein